jgi:glutamyl-tRNA reductase
MHLLMVGLNHWSCDVALREKVAFPANQLPEALCELCAAPSVRGAVVLSTCNRMEFYVQADDVDDAHSSLVSFIATSRKVVPSSFEPHLQVCADAAAVRHLFEVVSSLDSMVLGEQQIIGQVRTAFKIAREAETVPAALDHLFRQALEVGKCVRAQTAIGACHVSVSTVAVDVAHETFASLDDRNVLIVGSGEMSELAARYLREQGVRSFIVSSRTHAHACRLAAELDGEARSFEELGTLLAEADIIISSTAAPHYVITPELLTSCTRRRLILDIALPRDVDPACRTHPDITLYDLDDLGRIVSANQARRQHEAGFAQDIIAAEVEEFQCWVDAHQATPTIKEIRARAERVRAGEVQHLLECLDADLSAADQSAIEKATSAIVNKLLHEPTTRIRRSVVEDTDLACVETARFLFGLSENSASVPALRVDEALPVRR